MKPRTIILYIVLGALLLSMTGCVQMTEEYWVNADGTGKVHFELGLAEALLSMGDENEKIDGNELFESQGVAAENPYLKNVVTSQTSDNGMRYYTVDAEVTDFSKVFSNLENGESGFNVQVEKLDNGNYLFTRTMDFDKLNEGQNTGTQDGSIDMSGMVSAMFADKYWTIRLHSEGVVNTNGEWDKENEVVEWKVPMSQMFGGGGKTVMTAEFRMGPPILLYLVIGAGVLLLFVAGVVGLRFLKLSRANSESGSPVMDVSQQDS